MRKYLGLFGALALVALVIAACVPGGLPGTQKGAITFAVSNDVSRSQGVVPPNMDANHYAIHGEGQDGQAAGVVFDLNVAAGQTSIDLAQGHYVVTATVWSNGTPSAAIGGTSALINVVLGTPQTVPLNCIAYTDGQGTVNMTLGYVPSVILNPNASVFFADRLGVVTPATTMDVIFDSAVAAHGTISLASGTYVGYMQVRDGAALSAGLVRVVPVLKNLVTAWDEFFTVQMLQGGVSFDPSWTAPRPLVLQTNPAQGTVPTYSGNTVTLAVTGADAPLTGATYSWYENGDSTALGTNASFDVVADSLLLDRPYYFSVIVWTQDGSRAGDAQWVITKHTTTSDQFDVSGTAQGDGYVGSDYRICLNDSVSHSTLYQQILPPLGGTIPRPYSFINLAAGVYEIRVDPVGGGSGYTWPTLLVIPNGSPGPQVVNVTGAMN